MSIFGILLWPFPKDVIYGRNSPGPYLIRHTLLHTPWLRIYIHQILRSDDDEFCHCHPWNFTSFILSGGYIENLLDENKKIYFKLRKPGSLIRHKATDFHRIDLLRDKDGKEIPARTFVVCGKKRRDWGFMTDKGWVQWEEFLNRENHG